MKICDNNLVSQYLLILCLGIVLLMSQMSRLHVHIEHDADHVSTALSHAHTVSIHAAASFHDDAQIKEHSSTIDITPDNLVKQTNLLITISLFVLFLWVLFLIPHRRFFYHHRRYQKTFIPLAYLVTPPLRAPPAQ